MKIRYLIALALLPSLAAQAEEAPLPYSCDNGSRIDISFLADISGRPQARLQLANESITLPQVPAASGALYRNGELRLHTQGDDAVFEDGKGHRLRCSRGLRPPPGSQPVPPAASSFLDIGGKVSYRSRIALPPDAVLAIRISDRAGRTLVEQNYPLDGAQVPVPFKATVDRDLIGKKPRLTVTARITAGGRLRFAGRQTYRAMENGQPVPMEIKLNPAAAKRP